MRVISISLLTLFLFTIAGAQNLLTNGDFESWSAGIPEHWSISGSNLNTEEENTTVHAGVSSCKLTWTTTSTRWIQQEVPVTAGADYTFSFWAYDSDPFGRVRVYMRWYDSNGDRISNSEGGYTVDDSEWQELTLTAPAPAGAETVHVEVRVYDVQWGDSITSAVAYIDDASLTGGGGDVTPPNVTAAFSWGENSLEVFFDEVVDTSTAEDVSNYSIQDGLNIMDAQIDSSDDKLVHLTTQSQGDVHYTLITSNVEDLAGNPMLGDTNYFWGGISTIESARVDSDSNYIPDKKDDMITVEGTTSVEWYIVSASACFIQDTTGGIEIYTPGYDPQISRGDIVRVAGEVGQYTGTTEIKNVVGFEVIGQDVAPFPIIVLFSDFGEEYEGSLVRVEDVYNAGGDPWPESGSSANILITDGAGLDTVTLRIYYKTDIDGSPEPTWPIDIVGIMDQYDNASPYDEGYQIVARDLGDLTSVAVEEGQSIIELGILENPVRQNISISLTIKEREDVSLKIYNAAGQMVAELLSGESEPGQHILDWNIETTPNGLYFIKLETQYMVKVKKVLVLR